MKAVPLVLLMKAHHWSCKTLRREPLRRLEKDQEEPNRQDRFSS